MACADSNMLPRPFTIIRVIDTHSSAQNDTDSEGGSDSSNTIQSEEKDIEQRQTSHRVYPSAATPSEIHEESISSEISQILDGKDCAVLISGDTAKYWKEGELLQCAVNQIFESIQKV